MTRPPICLNVIPIRDIGATGKAHNTTTAGVLVPLVTVTPRSRADLLGEGFELLAALDPSTLEAWVSALRIGRRPGFSAA